MIHKDRFEKADGQFGTIVYSLGKEEEVCSYNEDLCVPLASAGKIFIGLVIAERVEEGRIAWEQMLNNIAFDPKENSDILYPHLQKRTSLPLRTVVEVMLACHDNYLAKNMVDQLGGWKAFNNKITSVYQSVNLTSDPFEYDNRGSLKDVFSAMLKIYNGYKLKPELYEPIVNGLVRQSEGLGDIPKEHYSHMSGGLPDLLLDTGILGQFTESPYLYVIAGKDLPDRSEHHSADERVIDFLHEIYHEANKATC
ncbi:serine hydrolase [Pseudalkalibacillus sp. SCS-8]|uniref:serine hydrolase n=1 Tax=Pseudalkalibacillus nanhaiensis TaxID=3115291 RepID=UPI0032DAA67F